MTEKAEWKKKRHMRIKFLLEYFWLEQPIHLTCWLPTWFPWHLKSISSHNFWREKLKFCCYQPEKRTPKTTKKLTCVVGSEQSWLYLGYRFSFKRCLTSLWVVWANPIKDPLVTMLLGKKAWLRYWLFPFSWSSKKCVINHFHLHLHLSKLSTINFQIVSYEY